MFLARKLVALSRASRIDPFAPDAAAKIAADPDTQEALAAVQCRLPEADPIAVLGLLLQAIEVEASDPRGGESVVECVATLPHAHNLPIRPTRIVIREMLTAARRSVLAAGYLITDGSDLLPLVHAAASRGVNLTFVCDRGREDARRIGQTWSAEIPIPQILVNAEPVNPDCKMHAKVLVTDDHHLLVTSANFTWHGQAVNFEYGLRVSGDPARKTVMFFRTLEQLGVLIPFQLGSP